MRVKYSQNFLADANVARRCVDALELTAGDAVLEIGPGRGALTALLLEKTRKLVAVEIDPELHEKLGEKFGDRAHFTPILSDFLDLDLAATPALAENDLKVIGNLPYAVVSPILQKLLEWGRWTRAVVMVQKEVGDRMTAGPGTKQYGVLTVSLQAKSRVEKVFGVPRGAFRPMPQVESSVLRITPLARPAVLPEEEKDFFSVVKGGFAHRRKTLFNSLAYALPLEPEKIKKGILAAGLSPDIRAEALDIEAFAKLAKAIYAQG